MRDLLHLKRNLRRRSIRKCTFFIVIKSSFFFVFNMIRDSSVNCLSRCCVPSTVIGILREVNRDVIAFIIFVKISILL